MILYWLGCFSPEWRNTFWISIRISKIAPNHFAGCYNINLIWSTCLNASPSIYLMIDSLLTKKDAPLQFANTIHEQIDFLHSVKSVKYSPTTLLAAMISTWYDQSVWMRPVNLYDWFTVDKERCWVAICKHESEK